MKNTENYQCPNCWGYQEYNESKPDLQICECNNQNK